MEEHRKSVRYHVVEILLVRRREFPRGLFHVSMETGNSLVRSCFPSGFPIGPSLHEPSFLFFVTVILAFSHSCIRDRGHAPFTGYRKRGRRTERRDAWYRPRPPPLYIS